MTVRIVLADDHPIVREGLRAVLETQSDFEVVAEAEDGREVVSAVTRLQRICCPRTAYTATYHRVYRL